MHYTSLARNEIGGKKALVQPYFSGFLASQSALPIVFIANDASKSSPKQHHPFKLISQANSVSNSSINTVNYDGNSSNPENDRAEQESEQRRLKKYKQYWKNASLDSDSGVSIKSSCDSLNSKKKLKESKSIIGVCPPSTQNKRKKQNNSEQYNNRNGAGQTFLIDLNSSLHSMAKSSKHADTLEVKSASLDIDTLQHMKNLDLNQDIPKETNPSCATVSIQTNTSTVVINSSDQFQTTEVPSKSADRIQVKSEENPSSINLNLSDKKSRQTLWSLLKSHSSTEEMLDQFGSSLHDKISFWDLVQLKIKHSTKNEVKTIYEITDDYTKFYSNMSTLLEGFVMEHSQESNSRSRSSSRNYRKT